MGMKWYVLKVYAGQEKRFVREMEAVRDGGVSGIGEIFAPREKVVEVVKGALLEKERGALPGYVFIKMDLNDDVLSAISSINKSTSFLGGEAPMPVSDKEINSMIGRLNDIASSSVSAFVVGERVRICDGPFTSFVGTVEDVMMEKCSLKVSVFVFGQSTPLEVAFDQVEKVKED
ncbi:transcription termination/antitermination protein NusG [Candidatus Gromoviella agglomerans]|uniref:transcription termination/antitermination protein NusG n=1 Tax=Candidatus Gromoviella agglomerans TaxID=2806609 RepID=UPI001E427B04|nr:transcription termination/antitermination protein NusG [Candidatus Gromoviella agglomerans]UFX98545.1 Transcription antitermination protein NusG [Candidatus Gromoviella agglomerans]